MEMPVMTFGDARESCLEPTAELAAHSWCLNPLCPEPGELRHPCAVRMGRKGGREEGQLRKPEVGGSRGWVLWRRSTVVCPQVNTPRAGWARARCGVMRQPLFARCHAEEPPEQHFEWCVHDTRRREEQAWGRAGPERSLPQM